MIKKCTLVIIALLSVVPVFAAAPLITDDTGTMGRGNIQIEGDYTGGVTGQYPGQQIAATLTYGDQRRIIFPVSDNYNSRKLLQIFVLPKQGKRLDSSEFSSLRVI